MKKSYILAGRLKGRDYSEDIRHRWEDNIKMYPEEMGWDWIHVAQNRDRWCIL
jgi:hypothetical protein